MIHTYEVAGHPWNRRGQLMGAISDADPECYTPKR
jgi:hypothetical protein